MPPITRSGTRRKDTPQDDQDRSRRTKDKGRKPDGNSGRTVGNREIDTPMLDAEHIEIGSNISTLTEEGAKAAAASCTKICETIYVRDRQDGSPDSPTREAECIHVAAYEIDVNPVSEENGIADPELDPVIRDAQDGESGSNGITSPTGTMEGVDYGNGEASPLTCRGGSSSHTEGDTPVQNTIAGTAEVVDQGESNTSARTGNVTGNTSLSDSCDEQDQQEIGETSNIKMKNTIDNLSGSMAVNVSNMNRVTDSIFGSLTTAEGLIKSLRDTRKMEKRSRETSNVSSSPKLRARDESPIRKRRRVGGDLNEDSVPTNCSDERNIAELHGIGVSCGVNTGTSKAEMDKLKSTMNVPEVSSDGEGLTIFSKAGTNTGQINTEFHGMDTMGAVQGDNDVNMARIAETPGIGPKEPEVDGMDSSGEVNPRPCEVEKGIPIGDSSVPEVRSDNEVSRHSEGKANYRQSDKLLQEINSLNSVDYPSGATGTNQQNCDTDMPEVGNAQIGGDYNKARAIDGEKANDEQTHPELDAMESGGSMDADSLNADTEGQSGDSGMHEVGSQLDIDMPSKQGQGNADCNDEKAVEDAESILQRATKENGPAVDYIETGQTPQKMQVGCPTEPGSPQKQKGSFMEYTGVSPEDNLRRMELERSCMERLEMKNAHLLIDMIDSLYNGKVDVYYLLAFKMVLLIFPNKSWDHIRDRLPAMMGYAAGNVKTGLWYRVAGEVFAEYPSDQGVDKRIICWSQRLELYKGLKLGMKKLFEPTFRSKRTCVARWSSESLSLPTEIEEMAGKEGHCQFFQDYFSHYALCTAPIFQDTQLFRDEIRFAVSTLRLLILRENETSESMFFQLEAVTSDIATAREIGVTEATMRQDVERELLELDDEEMSVDTDEEEGLKRKTVGDSRKQRILDDVKETISHYQSEDRNSRTKFEKSIESIRRLQLEMKNLGNTTEVMETGFFQLYFYFFGRAAHPNSNSEIQKIFDVMLQKIRTEFNKSYIREAEMIQLLQLLKAAENQNQELRTKVEGFKTWYEVLKAKLLPIDPKRVIPNWRVESSTQSPKETGMHGSDGFTGAPMSNLGEDFERSKGGGTIEHDLVTESLNGDDEVDVMDIDDEERATEYLPKERIMNEMEDRIASRHLETPLETEIKKLRANAKAFEKLRKDEINGFKKRLKGYEDQAAELEEKNKGLENDFRQLYFRIFDKELPQNVHDGSQKPSDIIWEEMVKEFNKRRSREQEQNVRLQEEESSKARLMEEKRQQKERIQQQEQNLEDLWQRLREQQEANKEMQTNKQNIQIQLDASTQSYCALKDEIKQAYEEISRLKDKNDGLVEQVKRFETWYQGLEAKLLPMDYERKIQDRGLGSRTNSHKHTKTNHGDGSAGVSMSRQEEDFAALKAKVNKKEESLKSMEREIVDLLKEVEILKEKMTTELNEKEAAYDQKSQLETQLKSEVISLQKTIKEKDQDIKSLREKEKQYLAEIGKYESHIKSINDWMEKKKLQIKNLEEHLNDTDNKVREQERALDKNKKELEALKDEASIKAENEGFVQQERIRLQKKMEQLEQTMSDKEKKMDISNAILQEVEEEIKDLTITLATVMSTLHKERISKTCEIGKLSKTIECLQKAKREYDASIEDSNYLTKRVREMEEERTTVNVQDAIKEKDETISRLEQDIENIKDGHASEISLLSEELRKVKNQIKQEQKGDSGVTDFNDRCYPISERLEVAIQNLERWKESGDQLVESQKRIDHVFSTIESIPSRLEQVLTAHQPSASGDSVAQAAHDGILTKLETNVKDLKHAIDRQHTSSQKNVERTEMRHSVEEIDNLMARVNRQEEELSKELSRLTEQTSQLSSGIKDKDKQYNEVVNTLLSYKSKCESDFEKLNESVPVLGITQLTKQINELQEQIRALGPELKDKNQDLGTLREDICSIKAQTMTCQGDMKHREIIIERLPSDIQNLKSKLIDLEKAMTRQQIAYDEWRKTPHDTPTKNTQRDKSSNVSKLEGQINDLNHVISQLREKDRLMNEAQKLQNSTTERDSKLNGLKDTMDWLVEEVRKVQKRIRDSEAEAQERQYDMAKFLRLSTNAWISRQPTSEAASNGNDNHHDELDGLREELDQVEKNIMYFTSTFPPPSGQPFSTVMEERFLSKVPVTERLKVLIERVRHRIDDLQSSLEQAKLSYESAMRPERSRSTIVSQANEVATPVSELSMEFLTPTGQESGTIQSPTAQRQPRYTHGKHNSDPTEGGVLPDGSLTSGPRPPVKAAFTPTVTKEVSRISTAEGPEAFHSSTDKPMGSRKLEKEHALGSDSVRADLERLRASLIFHLCTMLFSSERTVNVEGLREGSQIFSRRTIGKGNLELLEKVIEGYSRQSMKSRGANKELRKITYKGRKAFPDPLLKTYTTIFKTLLTLTQHLDINEPTADADNARGKAAPLDKGTALQEGTRKPKRKRLNLAQPVKSVR
ncbi:hypothetical protein FANTH_8540 [Fusarium anthophilum]|uniref:Uncharacterized protein n=1 Tax=Fusarium anthophilum TaxID=48485 RepID=A0A8H4Z9T5_9HYPO|nr:hypothetical protein FANTH_8540 [Fusarium anthophilum]